MKRIKFLAIFLCIALCISIFTGCAKKESDTIKIGLIGPLTGEVAMYGTSVLKAVNLYVENYNEAGG